MPHLHVNRKALQSKCEESSYGNFVSRETILTLLVECNRDKDLAGGRKVHCLMIGNGIDSDSFLSDHLIRFFAAYESSLDAYIVFNSVGNPTVYTWQAMISVYMSSGENQKAIYVFNEMLQYGIKPDKVTYLYALRICSMLGSLEEGRRIHDQVLESGFISDLAIGSTLIDMYAKCGDHKEAFIVFEKLPRRDVVCWNALLGGYLYHGDGASALKIFQRMKQDSIGPDRITFLHLLKAYSLTKSIDDGYLMHYNIIILGLDSDVSIMTTLIDMYAKFESLEEACQIFDKSSVRNLVSWNAMIAGYVQQGYCLLAYEMFEKMKEDSILPDVSSWNVLIAGLTHREEGFSALEAFGRMQREGIQPNKVSFLCSLRACVTVGAVVPGQRIHDQIIRSGLESDIVVGNTIVDMYAKFGYLEEAHTVFNALSHQDVVTWNALLVGYTEHEQDCSVLELFGKMQQQHIEPDQFTLSCILKVCGNVGALEQGKIIHGKIFENYFKPDIVLASSLVDMYARCGSMKDAENVFYSLKRRDLASWNSMIAGYAQHGLCELAIQCLIDMKKAGMMPSDTTYISVLTACSHSGELKGWDLFKSMTDDTVNPRIEHFNSMIDLVGHSGNLYAAKELLDTMPHSPTMTSWLSLLHSCKLYDNKLLGQACFSQAFHLDRNLAAGYVLMANLHANYGCKNNS